MYNEYASTETIRRGASASTTGHEDFAGNKKPRLGISPKIFMELALVVEALAVVLLAIVLKFAYVELYLGDHRPWLPYIGSSIMLGGLLVMTFRFVGLSDPGYLLSHDLPVQKIIAGLASAFLILISMLFLLKVAENYSRIWVLLLFFCSFVVVLASRMALPRLGLYLKRHNFLVRRVAIYGAGQLGSEFAAHLLRNKSFMELSGVYDDCRTALEKESLEVRGGLDDLVDAGKNGELDQIIIALPNSDSELLSMVVSELSVLPLDVLVRPEITRTPCKIYGVQSYDDINLLVVQRTPLSEHEFMAKRAVDLVLSAIGILVLFPLLPLIAIAIKLDSPGRIFYVQRRHGYNHRVINVLKFRTMLDTGEGLEIRQAERDDPRITRVGAFLRRTSIDELPQLLNVFRGEMSLVGPRPHAISHNDHYSELVEKYANRHCVKPGISGLAQVNGFRGNTKDVEMMQKRINFDLEYIEKWSLGLDSKIILQTVLMMLRGNLSEDWSTKEQGGQQLAPAGRTVIVGEEAAAAEPAFTARIYDIDSAGPADDPVDDRAVPLCVDLDGTLVRSDLLVESFLELVKENPLYLFAVPYWLLGGKANLKYQIARRTEIPVSTLPYRQDVLDFVRAERKKGRKTVLATASYEKFADQVASHLGLFDEVLASDTRTNLAGTAKARQLCNRFGNGHFDYIGDSSTDLAVWPHARKAILVSARGKVEEKVRRLPVKTEILEARENRVWAFFRAIRPQHWLKNMLVFAPLMLSHEVGNAQLLLQGSIAFVVFCLAASSVYLLNDLLDLSADRKHRKKKNRPFAAGTLDLSAGLLLFPVFVATAFGLASFLPAPFMVALAAYLLVNLVYSGFLKKLVLADTLVLAGMFTLRIIAGGLAISIPASFWLIVFSMFIFFSLALVKRFVEISNTSLAVGQGVAGRGYRREDAGMVTMFGVASSFCAVMVLALYINSSDVRALYAIPDMIWFLCPLVMYMLGRVWILAQRNEMNEDPVLFAIKDRQSQFLVLGGTLLLWMASI